MIVKPLNLTVKNNKATLSEKVAFFLGDGGICLELTLKSVTLGFNNSEMIHDEYIDFATACVAWVKRPDGLCFQIPNVLIQDNKIHLYVEKEWCNDRVTEVGEHSVQLILHSEDNAQLTLPHFTFNVLEPIYEYIDAEILTEDYSPILTEVGNGIRISQLQETEYAYGYVPIVQDGTTKKVNIDLAEYATQDYVDTGIANFREESYTSSEVDELIDTHTHTEISGYTVTILTQAQYDALPTKDANTLYIIKEG